MTTETQELKACPMCGKKAVVSSWFSVDGRNHEWFVVRCVFGCVKSSDEKTAEEAITAWNARPREAELEAALEEAKGALEEIATQHKGPASYQIIARYALTRIRAAKGGE